MRVSLRPPPERYALSVLRRGTVVDARSTSRRSFPDPVPRFRPTSSCVRPSFFLSATVTRDLVSLFGHAGNESGSPWPGERACSRRFDQRSQTTPTPTVAKSSESGSQPSIPRGYARRNSRFDVIAKTGLTCFDTSMFAGGHLLRFLSLEHRMQFRAA